MYPITKPKSTINSLPGKWRKKLRASKIGPSMRQGSASHNSSIHKQRRIRQCYKKVNTNAVITDNITHIESSPGINYVTYNLIMPKGMANKVPCITQDGEYEDQISPCNDPNELGGNQGHPRQL